MDILHVTLCLALARRIHGTPSAVRTTAKRLAKKLHPNVRPVMRLVVESRDPLALVEKLISDYQESEIPITKEQ